MTRKQLLEKKNENIQLMERILDKAKMECRELDPTEQQMYDNLKVQVFELTDKIKALFDDTKEVEKEQDIEKRSLVDSILANKTIELRDMSTNTHGNAVTTNMFDQIFKKIAEKSNILSLMHRQYKILAIWNFYVKMMYKQLNLWEKRIQWHIQTSQLLKR